MSQPKTYVSGVSEILVLSYSQKGSCTGTFTETDGMTFLRACSKCIDLIVPSADFGSSLKVTSFSFNAASAASCICQRQHTV